MIYKDLTKQKDLLILCDCGHSAHQIILTTFDEKLPVVIAAFGVLIGWLIWG